MIELERRLDDPLLELLELRQHQLGSRRQKDPALEAQLAELREKVRAYETRSEPNPEPAEAPKGLVQLQKKTADGLVPVSSAAE